MTLSLLLTAVFWLSLIGVVYIFVGYLLLVWIASRVSPSQEVLPEVRASDHTRLTGRVSVLIAAGDEAHRLPQKIESLLACDESDRILEVVVGSDGSTDGTVDVINSFDDERVRAVAFPERRGKSAVLADLIPTLQGDIVIFTDARQHVSRQTITALCQRFEDPKIGVVSGELVLRTTDATNAAEGVGFYWKYEKFLRRCESRFRSVPGATGALYAVRRDVLKPPAADIILDDVAIPMLAIEQHTRCVFEPSAIAYDTPSSTTGQESIRKRRTIAGVVQLVRTYPRWLLPRLICRCGNNIWWEFMSHKVARLCAPPLLLACGLANAFLAIGSPFYLGLLVCQIGFYSAATAGFAAQRCGIRVKPLTAPMMFVSLNLTTVFALVDAARGRFTAAWQRAA